MIFSIALPSQSLIATQGLSYRNSLSLRPPSGKIQIMILRILPGEVLHRYIICVLAYPLESFWASDLYPHEFIELLPRIG